MACARLGRRLRPHRLRPDAQHFRATAGAQGEPMNDIAAPLRITPAADAGPPPTDARVAIDIRDLDFHYGKTRALSDVNLAVPANSVTAIIGPSGCGKSTLLRTINRIY